MDQVGEQRDRAAEDEDEGLKARGDAKDQEADQHRPQPGARAFDRGGDEAVAVAVLATVAVIVVVRVSVLAGLGVRVRGHDQAGTAGTAGARWA